MAGKATDIPVKPPRSAAAASAAQAWHPMAGLRREIDALLDDFGRGYWQPLRRSLFAAGPLVRRELTWESSGLTPPVDVIDNDKAYEIMAEVPGMDANDITVEVADGSLIIRGEKQEEKEETRRDYYLRERSYGSFERSFSIPEGVAVDRIEASFKNGVLTLLLPKKPEAQQPARKIAIKAA